MKTEIKNTKSIWKTTRLSDVVAIDRDGVDPTKINRDEPYVGLEHVDSSGEIIYGPTVGSADLKSTKFKFTPDHVLFGKLRPYLRKVARPERNGVCSTDILPLLPGNEIDRDYLFHWLRTDEVINRATSACAGANLQRLSPEKLRGFKFHYPSSLAEQKRIAAILDKADAIRRKLQQSLRLSDDFLRSVFLDMFGSDKRPKCERTPLGPFLEFMTSGGRGWSQYYAPTGARFIRSLDVQMNEIGEKDVAYVAAPNNAEAKRTRVRENDVLLTITGSLIGRVARVPKEHAGAYISQHVAILRLGKGLDPEFLARFLSMDEGQRLVQRSQYGQTKPGLNFDQIRRFTVPLPSAILQKRFVNIANRVNANSMNSRTFMSESETLFSSLQQRAFSGEL